MTFHLDRHKPMNVISATTSTNQSIFPSVGNNVCRANHTARFNITPTTAAVTADNAVVSFVLLRNRSIYGAPRNIQRKHGTKVVHVVINAPSVADSSGGRVPGW